MGNSFWTWQDEEELERLVLACSLKFQTILGAAHQQIQEMDGIQHEDFWRELETETAMNREGSPNPPPEPHSKLR